MVYSDSVAAGEEVVTARHNEENGKIMSHEEILSNYYWYFTKWRF